MSEDIHDDSHILPAAEWKRVRLDAEEYRTQSKHAYRLTKSSFPSVTGFTQCKYDGGAQPAGGVKFGVLHDAETPLSAGYAQSIASYFTRNTNSTSAHFMVDPIATVQMLDTSRIAWHCGNGNTRSIGVEQAGYASFTPAQWTTADGHAQMARVAALMRNINAAHGIGLYWMTDQQLRDAYAGKITGGWATHAQCSRVLGGSTHTDPTPNYPLTQLMALANQEDNMPTADEIAAAVWQYRVAGQPVQAQDRLYGIDSVQLPAIAKAVAAIPTTSTAATAADPAAIAAAVLAKLPADLAHQVVVEMGAQLSAGK